MIYDFEHFSLKLFVSQLNVCLQTQEFHSDIIEDYLKLLEHLQQSITEIMDFYIPHATKPNLHVMCPHCKEDDPPHIEFYHTAPVMCCRRGDRPREITRSRYIPCGIHAANVRRETGK